MIIFEQDQNIIQQDPQIQKQDSSLKKNSLPADTVGLNEKPDSLITTFLPQQFKDPVKTDSTIISFSRRFSDVVFSGQKDLSDKHSGEHSSRFPFSFLESTKNTQYSPVLPFTENLKDGQAMPGKPFNTDWIIILVVISAFIYSALSAFHGKFIHNIKSFILFKGIGEQSARDSGSLFHWQSGIINIVSVSGSALFFYLTAAFYEFIPFGISGIILWFIFFILVALIITLRFITCFLLGNISSEKALFDEYTATVFQFYHVTGFILFTLSVLLAYTRFFRPESLLDTGFVLIAMVYLMRILRLFLIFLKRDVSILYLILYLCALEFLPALIVMRYLTNLF